MANAIGDVWKCVVEFEQGEERGMIVFHRAVTLVNDTNEDVLGAALATELVSLADTLNTAFQGLSSHVVCATAQRVNVLNPTRIYTVFSTQLPSTGGTSVSAQDAVLMSSYPAAGGLIKSGRNFIPFLDENLMVAGQILAISVTAITNAIEPLLLDLIQLTSVADLKAVLWRTVGQIVVDVTSNVLRPVLATQRRRVLHHQNFS